jgi:hypothetical protein
MNGIWRSLCNVKFETYHGALVMVCSTFDWSLWIVAQIITSTCTVVTLSAYLNTIFTACFPLTPLVLILVSAVATWRGCPAALPMVTPTISPYCIPAVEFKFFGWNTLISSGLGIRTYWLTGRRSWRDFDIDLTLDWTILLLARGYKWATLFLGI